MSTNPAAREWEQPGAYPVAPGVFRIPLPLPGDALRAVNVYAIVDGDEVVMVDSGWALDESRAVLEAAMASFGRDLGNISRFLITHVHRDHYTQAVTIRRVLGSKVLLGSGEKPSMHEILTTTHQDRPQELILRLATHGAADLIARLNATVDIFGPPDQSIWETPDSWLDDGDHIAVGERALHAIATPGHTQGHLVFHDEKAGLMFAGDHLLPTITPSIGFESIPVDGSLSDYLRSLDAVLALPDAMLLPAHGPVQASTWLRAEVLKDHHRRRLDDMARAVDAGAHNGFEVATVIPWTSRLRSFGDLDMFNQMIAVNETVAHLEVLTEQGRVVRSVVDGVVRYS